MTEHNSVMITGASTGIGEHCTVGLAERGYRVFAGVRNDGDGERLREEGGENVVPVRIDVTEQRSIDAAKAEVARLLGPDPLHALFNNAGITVAGPLEFIQPSELRRQFEVNCVGQLAVTQAFLPMLRASRGRIVNTGSVSGLVVTPMTGAYCMSKFAMEAFSDTLRVELRPQGIHVVLLEPVAIATRIWDKGIDTFQKLIAEAPPEAKELYGAFMDAVEVGAEQQRANAASPQVVLDAVIDALEAPIPEARYRMGTGLAQHEALRALSDHERDDAILEAFGIEHCGTGLNPKKGDRT